MIRKVYEGAFVAFLVIVMACSLAIPDSDATTVTESGVTYDLLEGGGITMLKPSHMTEPHPLS
jgi:hypothetical protein